ncbi:MAG: LPXTG cell wall anchor domain-containing protein [Sporichthyaceae bacterium]
MKLRLNRSTGGATATVLAVFAGTCTALLLPAVGSVDAYAATLGQLQILPATGEASSTASTVFSTTTACPATSTDFVITMTGANLPEGVNALGNSALPEPGAALVDYPLARTWNDVVTSQAGTAPIDGVATLTMVCAGPGGNEGEFTATVTFVKGTGVESTYTVGNAAGPAPSSSPTPSASPSATSSPSTSPSPDSAPAPSSTPSPGAEPGESDGEGTGEGTGEECDTESAEPIPAGDEASEEAAEPADETVPADEPIEALSAAAEDTTAAATESVDATPDTAEAVTETTEAVTETAEDPDCVVPVNAENPSDTGTSSGDSLPDTGGDNPSQMLLVAGMFAIAGFLLLMFEAATRVRNGRRYDIEAF